MLPERDDHTPGDGAGGDSLEERLHRLKAVTDVALSRLDPEDLLPELLDRVRDLLGTDTAAVLLMDESGDFLVANAARGLEEEVRQGSRVPLGRGFAGTIAAKKRPVYIGEVTPATVVNPVLMLKGIESMLGVPLMFGDEVLGVLHVGSLHPRSFTEDDVALLEQAADRAAMALQAERTHADLAAAKVLQHSLTPSQLPAIAGLDVGSRYVAGHDFGVGGDWYDVFELDRHRLGIAIGDVMGRGLRAAAVMDRLRSALRAYALDEDDPAAVLRRMDRLTHHFEPGQMATVLYAVLDLDTETLRLSSAGHMPPALATPGERLRFVDLTGDIPLGVESEFPRHTIDVQLPPGALLCLFTDGLVERREESLNGPLAQLARVLVTGTGRTADEICAEVMAEMIGQKKVDDDITLLVLRTEDA